MLYMRRTSDTIRRWYEQHHLQRAHQRLLSAAHNWGGEVCSFAIAGEQPLYRLLHEKCLSNWLEKRDVYAAFDPKNTMGWRHWKPGHSISWEDVFVTCYGEQWWAHAQSGKKAWRAYKHQFVDKCCGMWSLQPFSSEDRSGDRLAPAGKISLPIFTGRDCTWQRLAHSFELRVDSLLLAQWTTLRAELQAPSP